jgi:4-amino-4-deoxy-L-arabinose transferase-like glycosyltransferase
MKISRGAVSQGDAFWLAIIVCVALLVRFAAIAGLDHTPFGDELAYKSMALNLKNGNGIVDSMGNYAMYNVGYPLFALYPVFLIFGENIFAARVLNALLGVLAVWLCYVVAKEAGAGRFGSLFAALLWAVYLPAGVYSFYLVKENLMIPIMLGTVLFVLRLWKNPTLFSAVICGVLFGLLALVGNAALSLGGALVLALAFASIPLKRKSFYFAAVAVTAALVVSPWLIRNYHVIGAPVLNTNGGFNLYLGNNPAANGKFISIAKTPRGDTWAVLRQRGEVYASEVLKKEAVDWIIANPLVFLKLALKKAAYFWMMPLHKGKHGQSTLEGVVRLLWAAQYLLLVIGALVTLFVRRLRTRDIVLMWVAVAAYTTVHMLFYSTFRYREPMMPFLCIMTALSLNALVISLLRGRGSGNIAGEGAGFVERLIRR